MKYLLVIFLACTLFSCTGLKINNGVTVITVKKQEIFCNVKKVDPNCKVEERVK